MNKEAAKSFLSWEGVNNRMLVAHFMTKKCRVSIIVVYALVGLTGGDSSNSDKFYVYLHEKSTGSI